MEHHQDSEYESAKVLVTVKTYPNSSKEYTELVCTAGVRLDGAYPQWIRLYPVPFRLLGRDEQYRKYEIVDVEIVKRNSDRRPESYSPRPGSIRPTGVVLRSSDGWKQRCEALSTLFDPAITMCKLHRDAVDFGTAAQSLALIRPRKIKPPVVVMNPEYQAAIDNPHPTPVSDLFGQEAQVVTPAPFKLAFNYLCDDPDCKGHRQTLIDWEFGAAGYNRLRDYGPQSVKRVITDLTRQFIEMPQRSGKELFFFVGNQHRRPQGFMILGLFYPDAAVAERTLLQRSLFS